MKFFALIFFILNFNYQNKSWAQENSNRSDSFRDVIEYLKELDRERILEAQRKRLLKLVPWTSICGEVFVIPDFQKEILQTNHGQCFLLLGGSIKVLKDDNQNQTSWVEYTNINENHGLGCSSGQRGTISFESLKTFSHRKVELITLMHELQQLLYNQGEEIFLGKTNNAPLSLQTGIYVGLDGLSLYNSTFPVRPLYSWRRVCHLDKTVILQKVGDLPNQNKSVYVYLSSKNNLNNQDCEDSTLFLLPQK